MMNNTTSTLPSDDQAVSLVKQSTTAGAFLLLLSTVGVALNLCLFLTLVLSPRLASFCNDLTLMMSITDFLIAAVTMPITVHDMFVGR